MLREEFRDYTTYYRIRAITQGAASPETMNLTGIPRQCITKYLNVLGANGPHNQGEGPIYEKGIYRVRDRALATWFRFIEPALTSGITDTTEALRLAQGRLEVHVAEASKEVAKKYVESLMARGLIRYDELGGFLHRGVEIDLVAIDHTNRVTHLFEVKWGDLGEADVVRIGREPWAKACHIPLENYDYKLHVIAGSYVGPGP